MSPRVLAVLALSLTLCLQGAGTVQAAKKYYPPGFTPPADQKAQPEPQVIIQQAPGGKQVIIKTVPVTRVVKPKPRDPLTVLIEEHRYFDALRMVDARLKQAPSNLSLQLTRGRILREQGNYQQALNQYRTILDKNRSRSVKASALNGLGWTYYQKALHEKQTGEEQSAVISLEAAEDAFKQATQQYAAMPYPWAGLGQIALTSGELQQAETYVRKARQLAPHDLIVGLTQAQLLMARKKPDEALQILYGLKKSSTHNPEVYLLLAQASLDTGKIDDAIINLKQLLEIVPEHTGALKLLSHSYERKMKPEDASQVLEKAIVLNPADESSVEALLKIYDQRGESERSILLLRTLLKEKPGQAAYGIWLLDRLARKQQWDEVYQAGTKFMGPVLTNPAESDEELQTLSSLFAQAVFAQGKGLLDPATLLNEPAVRQVSAYAQAHLKNEVAQGRPGFQDRLNLLLLNPLTELPALPDNLTVNAVDLPLALSVAYLAGEQTLHARLLTQASQSDQGLKAAQRLYELGDYPGADALVKQLLAAQPGLEEAKSLRQKLASARRAVEDQLKSLDMLPRRISEAYWQKAASEALKLGHGDWKTHARLAEALERRRETKLALVHQKLAAHYAPTERDREHWQRKADKTARRLDR